VFSLQDSSLLPMFEKAAVAEADMHPELLSPEADPIAALVSNVEKMSTGET
jgi:hypothetical protein